MAHKVFMEVLWVLRGNFLPVVAHRSRSGLVCASGGWQQTAGSAREVAVCATSATDQPSLYQQPCKNTIFLSYQNRRMHRDVTSSGSGWSSQREALPSVLWAAPATPPSLSTTAG